MAKTKARLEGELGEAQRQVHERDAEVARLLRKHAAASTAVQQLKGALDAQRAGAAREAQAHVAGHRDLGAQLRLAEAAVSELKTRLAEETRRPPPPCPRCPDYERRLIACVCVLCVCVFLIFF
jgi:hypothetical protein